MLVVRNPGIYGMVVKLSLRPLEPRSTPNELVALPKRLEHSVRSMSWLLLTTSDHAVLGREEKIID